MERVADLLLLDDCADDLELIEAELRRGGVVFKSRRVHSKQCFSEALQAATPDLILTDHVIPGYDGFSALAHAQERAPGVPVILVSGLLGEELAIESLKRGATDYVLKDRLGRLVPAVRRALEEVRQRKQQEQAESAVRESEARFAAFAESIPAIIFIHQDGEFRYVNSAAELILGYSRAELLTMQFWEVLHPHSRARVREQAARRERGELVPAQSEFQIINKAGETRWLECTACRIKIEDRWAVMGSAFDITTRKESEKLLRGFSRLGLELSAASNSGEAAKIVVEIASELFGWDACYLHLYSAELDQILPVLTIDTIDGRKTTVSENSFTREPSPMMREVMEKGARLINRGAGPSKSGSGSEIGPAPACVPFGDKTRRSASMMYVPIRHGWKQVGILSIQSYKPRAYSEADLERLQALANHCAGAMERIRALAEWKRLEREILHISAREQRRIGHDLHDGLGQFLGGVAFQAKLLEDSLATEKSTHLAEAKQVVRLLNNAIRQTRTLAHGLDPIALAANGLGSALHRLADNTRSVFRVNCSAKIESGFEPVDANASHQLYRIAQEAINNAVQHGQARHVQLQLGFKSGQLCLTIRDDGRGFGPEKKKDTGMGLRIMEYRARSLGGLVKISSKPKQGTEVRCLVPKVLMNATPPPSPAPGELPRSAPPAPRPRA